MKICWDNLENLKYREDKGMLQHINFNFYYYKDNCKNCNEPFLTSNENGKYCNHKCYHSAKEYKDNQRNNRKLYGYYGKNIPTYNKYACKISYAEKVRKNKKDKNILEVKCDYCGRWYIPLLLSVQNRIRSLEGKKAGESRLYCSNNCKQECPIYWKQLYPEGFKIATSREVQPELRQMVLKRDNYTCQKCNKHQDKLKTGLHCHHLEGIRWEPLESADMDKCTTLCKECHIIAHKLPDCGYHDLKCKGGGHNR